MNADVTASTAGLAGIKGSLVALVTPMHDDGSLDLEGFDRLLEWHIKAGTDGIVVAGTTGESATLTMQEHCDLVARCVKVVAGRVPVIAGSGSNNTAEALHLTRAAKEHGADACLLVTPYYNKPSQEGLYRHFKSIAEAVDIPQILYNVPGRTVSDLSQETVLRLAELSNIQGIKDATGDVARGLELLKRLDGRLLVYSGEDAVTLQLMRGGAAGAVSVTANAAPQAMARLCAAALAGDFKAAAAADRELAALHRELFCQSNPMPVKWALHRMGRIGSGIRLPLVELEPQYQVKVTEALVQAGISLPADSWAASD